MGHPFQGESVVHVASDIFDVLKGHSFHIFFAVGCYLLLA
jgi:hypothetical protein